MNAPRSCPNGALAISPGLRGTSYFGFGVVDCWQPQLGCGRFVTLFGLLLLLGVGCREAESESGGHRSDSSSGTNDITTKVSERDRDKDGKPDSRTEQYFRNGQRVMVVMSRVNAKGGWNVTSRAYHVGGKTVSIEGDDDGDGVFETLIVYRADSDDMEVFTRDASGSVRPASTQVLEAHKRQNAAFAEFFENTLMATNLDSATVEERIRATQKKIQETQQEINDGRRQ